MFVLSPSKRNDVTSSALSACVCYLSFFHVCAWPWSCNKVKKKKSCTICYFNSRFNSPPTRHRIGQKQNNPACANLVPANRFLNPPVQVRIFFDIGSFGGWGIDNLLLSSTSTSSSLITIINLSSTVCLWDVNASRFILILFFGRCLKKEMKKNKIPFLLIAKYLI